MDDDGLNDFIQTLLTMFMDGGFSAAGDYVVFPVVYYTAVGVAVFRTPEELISNTQQYREAFATLGVPKTSFEIEERSEPKNDRMRVLVKFMNHLPDGRSVQGGRVRYFLWTSGGSYKVEMMEFLDSALSVEQVDRIIH